MSLREEERFYAVVSRHWHVASADFVVKRLFRSLTAVFIDVTKWHQWIAQI